MVNAASVEQFLVASPWARPLSARLMAFISGFCLMLVEVASGRVLAPYLGVSVYTWTSVIGATLLGIALGNYVGGYLADHRLSRKVFAICVCGAGMAVLFSNYLAPIIGNVLAGMALPIWMKTLFFSCAAFAPAAFFLSTIPPQVVKFDLHEIRRVATRVGSLGAWSAIGSIAGTFLGGFVFVSWLGTKQTLTWIAIILLILGLALSTGYRLWKNRLAALTAAFLLVDFFIPGICKVETQYYCIRIDQGATAGIANYTLRLDHLIHSYVTPAKPARLGYGYEQVYSNLIAMRHQPNDAFRSFFVGGGGYALPRYLEKYYPKSQVVVAEIDPGVTAANKTMMELSATTTIETHNMDARLYLTQSSAEQTFDLAFGDAFNDFSVPYHLTTLEFHQLLKRRMTPNGVYALNVIDDARYGNFLASMIRTLNRVWQHVYVAPQGFDISPGRNTIILLASDQAIDLKTWNSVSLPVVAEASAQPEPPAQALNIISPERVAAFLKDHPAPILVDDFVPTDRYLAPVFRDAY